MELSNTKKLTNLLAGLSIVASTALTNSAFAGLCTYRIHDVNHQHDQFTADVTMFNDGSDAIADYSFDMEYMNSNRVQIFYGIISGTNPYTVSHEVSDGPIEPGQNVSMFMFGRIGSDGVVEPPVFSGEACQPNNIGQAPYTVQFIPGTIQAEYFDHGGEDVSYNDATAGNSGNSSRHDENVDLQWSRDTDRSQNVGWTADGEFLEYTIANVEPGDYNVEVRYAAARAQSGRKLRIVMNDGYAYQASVNIGSTGGWQKWQSAVGQIQLEGGTNQTLRLQIIGGNFNINWVKFTKR